MNDAVNDLGGSVPAGSGGGVPVDARTLISVMGELAVPPCGIERTSVVPLGAGRRENDAEHSFALGLVALCLAPLVDGTLDLGLIAKYALVHDLPEIHSGDVSVYADPADLEKKALREEEARETITRDFGELFPWLIQEMYGYKAQGDPESRFVYALDKLLPHVNVLLADYHPVRPTWEAYKHTEEVARRKINASCPALIPLFEELCREFAQRPHLFSGVPGSSGVSGATRSSRGARDDDGREGEQGGPGHG
ncbi:HD family hydrolase [Microbispora sp. NPDC049125]|uniref:HD domain-containing protein n=1 Tax=Microbispora sp. NPDC049125 TaxID=3154929 RepID=UPI003464F949